MQPFLTAFLIYYLCQQLYHCHYLFIWAIRTMEPAWVKECGRKFALTSQRVNMPQGGIRLIPVFALTIATPYEWLFRVGSMTDGSGNLGAVECQIRLNEGVLTAAEFLLWQATIGRATNSSERGRIRGWTNRSPLEEDRRLWLSTYNGQHFQDITATEMFKISWIFNMNEHKGFFQHE